MKSYKKEYILHQRLNKIKQGYYSNVWNIKHLMLLHSHQQLINDQKIEELMDLIPLAFLYGSQTLHLPQEYPTASKVFTMT